MALQWCLAWDFVDGVNVLLAGQVVVKHRLDIVDHVNAQYIVVHERKAGLGGIAVHLQHDTQRLRAHYAPATLLNDIVLGFGTIKRHAACAPLALWSQR